MKANEGSCEDFLATVGVSRLGMGFLEVSDTVSRSPAAPDDHGGAVGETPHNHNGSACRRKLVILTESAHFSYGMGPISDPLLSPAD
jgi:hypothetical protein